MKQLEFKRRKRRRVLYTILYLIWFSLNTYVRHSNLFLISQRRRSIQYYAIQYNTIQHYHGSMWILSREVFFVCIWLTLFYTKRCKLIKWYLLLSQNTHRTLKNVIRLFHVDSLTYQSFCVRFIVITAVNTIKCYLHVDLW